MSRAAIRAAELRVLAAADAFDTVPWPELGGAFRELRASLRALRRLTKPKPRKEKRRGK